MVGAQLRVLRHLVEGEALRFARLSELSAHFGHRRHT
jgi:hypothetical protein